MRRRSRVISSGQRQHGPMRPSLLEPRGWATAPRLVARGAVVQRKRGPTRPLQTRRATVWCTLDRRWSHGPMRSSLARRWPQEFASSGSAGLGAVAVVPVAHPFVCCCSGVASRRGSQSDGGNLCPTPLRAPRAGHLAKRTLFGHELKGVSKLLRSPGRSSATGSPRPSPMVGRVTVAGVAVRSGFALPP